jgi:undecaprenyl diphosphate synthase
MHRARHPYLTLSRFEQNWRRPQDGVDPDGPVPARAGTGGREADENGIRFKVAGDTSRFDPRIRELIAAGEALTAGNARLTLTIAANYGGRWDVAQAARRFFIAHPEAAREGGEFRPEALEPFLAMAYAPEPDLFIRTGGEQRISNFLLWQLAYTELYFTPTLWRISTRRARCRDRLVPPARRRPGAPANRSRPRSAHDAPPSRHGPVPASHFAMLSARILTALILIPLVVAGLFLLPAKAWGAVTLVAIAAAAAEWADLAGFRRQAWLLFVVGTLLIGGNLLFAPWSGFGRGWPDGVVLAVCGPAALFWIIVSPPWLRFNWRPASWLGMAVAGWLVLIGAWVAIVQLQARSPWLVLAAMAIVWVADTAAYFTGRVWPAQAAGDQSKDMVWAAPRRRRLCARPGAARAEAG